ncbi:GNAT family N-acetyltransferase [Cyanosarcina cf. burmensis CCALA 770]|nr:GNAT family N-acetyltransferase [Cyanosarcina cf. burmensis CCALA 770]
MNMEVTRLQHSQIESASEVLAHAFNHDPTFRYFTKEEEQKRMKAIKCYAKAKLRYSLLYNQIYTTTNDLKGIAIWIPPGKFPLNDIRLLSLGLYALPFHLRLSRLAELPSLLSTIEQYHKQDLPAPHWYLSMLGVSPTYQRQGVGSLLLQPIIKQADNEGLPCYLETSTEGGVRLYQRHGFEIVRSESLLTGKLKLWTMKREPLNELRKPLTLETNNIPSKR